MGARQKLNAFYFNGALLVAGIVGIVTQSFTACVITLAVLVAASLCCGEIRPQSNRR